MHGRDVRHCALVPQPETMRRPQDSLVFGELLAKTILPWTGFSSYPFSYLSGIVLTTAAALLSQMAFLKQPGRIALRASYVIIALLMLATWKLVPVGDSETLFRYATSLPGGGRRESLR